MGSMISIQSYAPSFPFWGLRLRVDHVVKHWFTEPIVSHRMRVVYVLRIAPR